jgi:LMBR1 domain-containing protein 1
MGSCTIVKTNRGRYVDETLPYIESILRYLKVNLNITFKEFAADFIRDAQGIWWFINVKSFILDEHPPSINIKPITLFGELEAMAILEK